MSTLRSMEKRELNQADKKLLKTIQSGWETRAP